MAIIAGAPAFHLSRAMIAEAWNNQAFAALAPKSSGGPPSLAQAFTDHELQLVADAVLAKCDALDGARDGLIGDPMACHFDPQVLSLPGRSRPRVPVRREGDGIAQGVRRAQE